MDSISFREKIIVEDVVFLGDKYHQSDGENGVLSVNTPKYKGFQLGFNICHPDLKG